MVNSQIEQNNSGRQKHCPDVRPFVIARIQNNSDRQKEDDIEFSPKADSGIQSPARSIQHPPRSQSSSPHGYRASFLLLQLQSHTLPMTPMPKQPPELPNPMNDSQPFNSIKPPNLTEATDKGKIDNFATKGREKYKRKALNGSVRKLKRKGYKD